MNIITREVAVVPVTFGGGGSCHRIAEHIRKGRTVLPPPPQMTPHVLKHLARVAQVRVGAGSIPAVQGHLARQVTMGSGSIPAARRHLIRQVTMGSSASPALQRHFDRQP
jgi:hypothetical protein